MSNPQSKRKPTPFPFIRTEVYKWIRQNSTAAGVINYKVGGGRPAWNGRK
ncbi:hypothetical protein QO009_002017 [Brevibacillus aydinogluensis]|nr:hypothetical protein [Brevibacillus aydinogluensis]MDT3416149.1 hypothetical protein [Brevibacillus aydinogluensis]